MRKIAAFMGLVGLLSIFGCSETTYKPGDLYSVDDGKGKIAIVKVLVVDPKVIHLRLYKNTFEERPKTIDTKELSLGRIGEEGAIGIGHIPLDIAGFKDWKPELLLNEEVKKEELVGYNFWKESQ